MTERDLENKLKTIAKTAHHDSQDFCDEDGRWVDFCQIYIVYDIASDKMAKLIRRVLKMDANTSISTLAESHPAIHTIYFRCCLNASNALDAEIDGCSAGREE